MGDRWYRDAGGGGYGGDRVRGHGGDCSVCVIYIHMYIIYYQGDDEVGEHRHTSLDNEAIQAVGKGKGVFGEEVVEWKRRCQEPQQWQVSS